MYDREHSKIGFWKTNCSELWETLHISDAPPPISPAFNENVTTEVPPTLAPAPYEAPDYVLPGLAAANFVFHTSEFRWHS